MKDQWILIGVLERFAEVAQRQCDEDEDGQQRAYKAGFADGLRRATTLIRTISREEPACSAQV